MKHSTVKVGYSERDSSSPPNDMTLSLRVGVLKDLARALLMEVEAVEIFTRGAIIRRAEAFFSPLAEGPRSISVLESAGGISFYEAVPLFEIELVRLALKKQTATSARQRR